MKVQQAEREVEIAEKLTPGLWAAHSRVTAVNARLIAERCGLDGDKAYVFGLLHDIGRRKGSWNVKHIFDGYEYMTAMGEHEIARICITHTFPLQKRITEYLEFLDCNTEEREFLKRYLSSVEYDDYDLLIQLCDAISLPSGACIMEKRLIDVALRHGVHDFTVDKWRAFIGLKNYFDGKCGVNIYTFLPDVIENSFGNLV